MEKLIAMVICTILVVALVGCSTSKDGNYPATMVFLKRMEKQILIKIPERHTQFLKMVW